MHELSIMQSVVDLCLQSSCGRRVVAVTLEVGELSGVVPEALEFCFEACTAETLLEGAALAIEKRPGRGRCSCGAEFRLSSWCAPCPVCGSFGAVILSGEELRVKEMEVL